jgi:hypothetical protein
MPSAMRQFFRLYALPGVPRIVTWPPLSTSRVSTRSPHLRDCSKPSGLTTGTTTTRLVCSKPTIRALRAAYPLTRSIANSIVFSPEGHSRAWCRPMIRNVGLPSTVDATLSLISTPRMSRPSSVLRLSVSSRTSEGFALASERRSAS